MLNAPLHSTTLTIRGSVCLVCEGRLRIQILVGDPS
jgi:hypothetical protein